MQADSLPAEPPGKPHYLLFNRDTQVVLAVKNLPARCDPWVGKIPWRRAWQSTPVFLPGESHGQRSLAGYSPWVTGSDTTERLTLSLSHFTLLLLPAFQECHLGFLVSLYLVHNFPDCICIQLFSVPSIFFVFCCSRRCLSANGLRS